MGEAVALVADGSAPSRRKAGSEHNLNGQRLGRKGRDTRDRIMAATRELLDDADEPQITLSAVARKAGLGMTSLYAYFSDLTELLVALLEPVVTEAQEGYFSHLRNRWPDDRITENCQDFLADYFAFWSSNSRLLHLRNAMSEGSNDERMIAHRIRAGLPMVKMIVMQMDGDPSDPTRLDYGMATALCTGLDRLLALRTSGRSSPKIPIQVLPALEMQLQAEARLIELAIRDCRRQNAANGASTLRAQGTN